MNDKSGGNCLKCGMEYPVACVWADEYACLVGYGKLRDEAAKGSRKRRVQRTDSLFQFLNGHPAQAYSAEAIMQEMGISHFALGPTVRTCLKKLVDEGRITRRPTGIQGKGARYVYFVGDTANPPTP